MSLSQYRRLSEVRADVAIGLGMSSQGLYGTDIARMIDFWLRESQNELFFKYSWLRNVTSKTITLITNNTLYDWPDDVQDGEITNVTVVNATGRRFDLTPGISTEVRNNYYLSGAGRPAFYDFTDGAVEIIPKPDVANYPSITLEIEVGPSALVNEDDRLSVEDSLVMQRAILKGRDFYGMGDTKSAWATHRDYIQERGAMQDIGQSWQVASRRWSGPIRLRNNSGRMFTSDWTPDGF
jgi:hypothetical protein